MLAFVPLLCNDISDCMEMADSFSGLSACSSVVCSLSVLVTFLEIWMATVVLNASCAGNCVGAVYVARKGNGINVVEILKLLIRLGGQD